MLELFTRMMHGVQSVGLADRFKGFLSLHGQEISGYFAEGYLLHVARCKLPPYHSFHLFSIITRRPSLDREVGIDVECQDPRRYRLANPIRKEVE